MNFLKKNPSLREQKQELTRYGMQNPKLLPELIPPFAQMTRAIYGRFQHVSQNDFGEAFKSKVKEIMSILKSIYSESTLNFITKKMAFLFVFLNYTSLDKRIDENLSAYFTEQVQNLLKEIDELANPEIKRQRSSSLKKIQLYLREKSLLGKKDDDSKLKIELNDDKTVIKRVLKEVVEPFCVYMLKILQDHRLYSTFIRKQTETINGSDTWKMFNWINIMGSIVLEMNRLARYFKDDLVGVWVFISYLISIDVSEYYSNIIVKMHQLSRNWMEKIKTVHQIKKVNRQKAKVDSSEILKHPEFMELRNYIEEIQKIRESMKYLYNNARMKEFKGYFIHPKFSIAQKVADNKLFQEEIRVFYEEFDNCHKSSALNSKQSASSLRRGNLQNPESTKTKETSTSKSQQTAMDRPIDKNPTAGDKLVVPCPESSDQPVPNTNAFQSKKTGFFAQKRNTIMGRN